MLPNQYVLVVSPKVARIVMAGLGKLPGEIMFEAATELRAQLAQQDEDAAIGTGVALSPAPHKPLQVLPLTAQGALHKSDCAIHNMPASAAGACDCGAQTPLADAAG